MATLDPNGVLLYQDTDNYTPIHTALNLAQSNLSSLLGANPRFKRVTNVAARLALVTSIGAINITPANPLLVWRANATAGSQLEYTTDGVTWDTYVSQAYLDSLDTGWVTVSPATGFVATSPLRVRRTADGFIHWQGRLAGTIAVGATTAISATVPSWANPSGGFAGSFSPVASGSAQLGTASVSGGFVQVHFKMSVADVMLKGLSGYM